MSYHDNDSFEISSKRRDDQRKKPHRTKKTKKWIYVEAWIIGLIVVATWVNALAMMLSG